MYMVNEKGYDVINIRPDTKRVFDYVQENEPIAGQSTQDAVLRHLLVEAGYEERL